MSAENFELVKTTQGALSIKDGRVGEIMHNPLGPWAEVEALYLAPSQLKARLQDLSTQKQLVLYDVGLGAGSNAMVALLAALQVHRHQGRAKGFRILSFEQDLRLAKFALQHRSSFPEFGEAWLAFETLLDQGYWKHEGLAIQWELHAGDFTQILETKLPIADLIFYDPYSPKKNSEMWTYKIFCQLREKCHSSGGLESLLLTYSRATSVRAALLLAGFFVGQGEALGLKEETTLASTRGDTLEAPLAERWLQRWQRSHQALPSDLAQEDEAQVKRYSEQLLAHPQFD